MTKFRTSSYKGTTLNLGNEQAIEINKQGEGYADVEAWAYLTRINEGKGTCIFERIDFNREDLERKEAERRRT